MRQLKITKSNRERLVLIHIKEYLRSENFNLEEFAKLIPEMEQAMKYDTEYLVEVFQDLERSCILAMSHLHGQSYEELIAKVREDGEEINKLWWLNARNVLAIAQEYQDAGVSIQDLLLAGMQGVKNAAFAYRFTPNEDFTTFATPIVRKHIEQYVQTGEIPYSQSENEYEMVHSQALESHNEHCQGNGRLEKFLRLNPAKQRAHFFATSKINRCRKEVIEIADLVEWKKVDMALHLPDDYDERDKFIRTKPYRINDALYDGECQDLVKPCGGEWCTCTKPEGERIAISALTDRE